MAKKSIKKTEAKMVSFDAKLFGELILVLDRLGFNNRVGNPDYPGTTEMIAIELKDLRKIAERIAVSLENLVEFYGAQNQDS